MTGPGVIISGTGHELPSRVITNGDIEQIIDTSDAFIRERTGVVERRHLSPGQGLADLMIPAAEAALADAGLAARDIGMLIVNTLSPDNHDPSQACFIQTRLGLRTVPCFDIRAQCSGGLYGLDIARHYLRPDSDCRAVMVLCGEALSKRLDVSRDGRNLSVLLGDGAGAFIVERAGRAGHGVLDVALGADGSQFDLLKTTAPGSLGAAYLDVEDVTAGRHFFRMQGAEMFADAVARICQAARNIVARNGLDLSDLDLIIPHQPNLRILEAAIAELGVPRERMFITVEKLGNMASASFPVALDLARRSNAMKPGGLTLFVTYGSGATWGAALYRA